MSVQDSGVQSYAYWNSPDGSFRVIYSLPLFHEIDMSVNEGYRMIPRGGVETAGLLFGTVRSDAIRIDRFRPIDCQHAMGPSFTLSEQDLERLRNQLVDVKADPELAGLQVIGWFIGHTRNPLRMNDAEVRWFEDLIPGSPRVTVLVKPEHFQPTRFSFLLRRAGAFEQDATESAIILPLPGRAAETDAAPSPSIPAPFNRPVAPASAPVVSASTPPVAPQHLEPATVTQPPSVDVPEILPVPAELPDGELFSRADSEAEKIAENEPAEKVEPVAKPTFLREPFAAPGPTAIDVPPSATPMRPHVEAPPAETPRVPVVVPGSKQFPRTPEPSDNLGANLRAQFQNPRYETLAETSGRGPHLRFAAILLLSAILGCIAGYWAYLQLPAPIIPLTVREEGRDLILEWPAKQTESVDYAALRINDGPPFSLTASQREAGTVRITPPPGNVKFELIAKHWLRDSRGIVRYIRASARLSWPEVSLLLLS